MSSLRQNQCDMYVYLDMPTCSRHTCQGACASYVRQLEAHLTKFGALKMM